MVTVTLMRPLRMLFFELIVSATCLYLSLAYGIFYMYFGTYFIVFQGIYRQSPGVAGLMFLPIGIGTVLAIGVFLWYDASYEKRKPRINRGHTEKNRVVSHSPASAGLYTFSRSSGWTARPDIPFVVPMLAGIPFGLGFVLIFMALLNYLTDAYMVFAASAMAAASCARSLAGAVLPFAARPMYERLGVAWASSLLGFLSLVMCGIPFVFLWKGGQIRAGSRFCLFLKEKKEREQEELKRERAMTTSEVAYGEKGNI